VKGLLSAPIDAFVQDSDTVRQILEEVKSQLPAVLQIKLWPTGHLPFFQARVEQARHRIEARHSQAPLKADIIERCRFLNKKKATLDTKVDTSVHSQRLQLLEKELEDLKAKVRATEHRIQEEKNLIASSEREAENLTAQLKIELAELSALSRPWCRERIRTMKQLLLKLISSVLRLSPPSMSSFSRLPCSHPL
jgi:hypothetical protein